MASYYFGTNIAYEFATIGQIHTSFTMGMHFSYVFMTVLIKCMAAEKETSSEPVEYVLWLGREISC